MVFLLLLCSVAVVLTFYLIACFLALFVCLFVCVFHFMRLLPKAGEAGADDDEKRTRRKIARGQPVQVQHQCSGCSKDNGSPVDSYSDSGSRRSSRAS